MGRHHLPEPDWSAEDSWQEQVQDIGELCFPHLEELLDELPNALLAQVATLDGFNLCAVGLGEESVGQFAALASSLNSVARASVDGLPDGDGQSDLDVVSIQAGDTWILYVTFAHPVMGSLILVAAARDTPIGELLLYSRRAAQNLEEALHDV